MTSDETVPALKLRAATLADVPSIFDVTLAAYEEYRSWLVPASGVFSESLADVEQAIAHGGAVIAYLDRQTAGCGRYQPAEDGSHLYFDRLSVLPAYRRRGIAAAMVRWFERRAAELGLPEVRLGVRLALPGNIALYHSLGYEIYDYEHRPGYGRISAEMRKRLQPPARHAGQP